MSLPVHSSDKVSRNISLSDKCGSFDILRGNLVVEIGIRKFNALRCIVVSGSSVEVVVYKNTEHDEHDDQQPAVQGIKWARLWRLPVWTPGWSVARRLSIVHVL